MKLKYADILNFSMLPEKPKGTAGVASTYYKYIDKELSKLADDPNMSYYKQEFMKFEALEIILATKNSKTLEFQTPDLHKKFRDKMEERFKVEPEIWKIVSDVFPTLQTIKSWRSEPDYSDLVWKLIRSSELFSPDKKQQVINSLYNNAVQNKSTAAAKVWLTLSGDYVEKSETNDKSIDTYRDIQQAILKKRGQ